MHKHAPTVALAAVMAAALGGPAAIEAMAQQAPAAASSVEGGLLLKGAQLYSDNCAQCHQPGGAGTPPSYPALAGNDNLQDLGLLVGNVRNGKNSMPAFPDLTVDEIAAIATYARNSWGNAFGPATPDEVTAIIGSLGRPASATAGLSIWDGVFTQEQAARGAAVQSGVCAKCHGAGLNGAGQPDQPPSPAIARAGFLKRWEGQTVRALFEYVRTKMPLDNPGQLTDRQNIDAVAGMLAVSGLPAGGTELPADPEALAGIVIRAQAQ